MLEIPSFYSDVEQPVIYSSLTLPDGSAAPSTCSVSLDFHGQKTGKTYSTTSSVSVSNGVSSVILTVPASTLTPDRYRWRTVLIDGQDRYTVDTGLVDVEGF